MCTVLTSPVSNSIGLGAWQASCSGEGSLSSPETKSQKGLVVFEPCVKSNSPGPSVVPAAKLKIKSSTFFKATY